MSIAHAKNGPAIKPRAAEDTPSQVSAHRPTDGLDQDQGLLLAQVPDLDPKATPKSPEKRADGRVISQALSFKLVFGLGVVLVILAIVFGKASRPSSAVTELPAWSNHGSTTGIADSTSQTLAPTWPSSATAPVTAAVPGNSSPASAPAILLPQPRQVGDARPTGMNEPGWPQPRSSVAPPPAITPSPPPSNYINPPVVDTNRPDNRGDYRGLERPVDPRNLQADNRNDPTSPYRTSDTRYDYRPNTLEGAAVRRELPAGGYPRDTRYDNVNGNYPPPAGSGGALMPSGTLGPAPDYRGPQVSEPGVARFDGIISTPPVRTNQ